VVGFELGADDYITKPFSPREMVLRVQAVLRRTAGWQGAALAGDPMQRSLPQGVKAVSGPILLDYDRCKVLVGERTIEFSPIEFKLISILAEKPGTVHSREKLLNEVWGYKSGTETRVVDMHMFRLREKLGPASNCLETVRGFGYRIIDPSSP